MPPKLSVITLSTSSTITFNLLINSEFSLGFLKAKLRSLCADCFKLISVDEFMSIVGSVILTATCDPGTPTPGLDPSVRSLPM